MWERPHDSDPDDPNGASVWRCTLPRDCAAKKVPHPEMLPKFIHPEAALEGGPREPEEWAAERRVWWGAVPRLSDAPVDGLVGVHQTVRRRDSGTLHDCKEEIQKLPVYQLQRQEGDQSMQCSHLLARVRVFQGCTLDSTVTNGWIVCLLVCLRQFKLCTLVFTSAVWFAQ